MNRSFDIFRMSANGVDADRGTGRMGQNEPRTNHPADPPFDHGLHQHDVSRQHHHDEEAWGQRAQRLEGSADYGNRNQQTMMPGGGYGGFIGDRERFVADRQREELERSERMRYEGRPRSWSSADRFPQAIHEMHGYPQQSGGYGGGYHEPVPPSGGHVEPWRGRNEDYDFWGYERHPHDTHPSLWQRVKGVFTGRGPKNYVRSDDRIREDVCEHLSYHPYVDASDIEVIVRDGEVTLSGTVDARMVKRAAEECCDHVRGVKDVHNHLRVRPPVPTSPVTT
jgi:hypothetical protein